MEEKEQLERDTRFMKLAMDQALRALESDEVPIGAVVVLGNQIIAKGYNQVETLKDATAHAEMIALTSAANYLNSKYLKDCTLYVTLEPCLMCASALKWSQVGRIVFGAYDVQHGFTKYHTDTNLILHPKTLYNGGIERDSCAALVTQFFKSKR